MKVVKIACIFFLVVSLAWSCNSGEKESNNKKQGTKVEQAQPAAPSGETDKFGRKPGEQHYGHNHGSNEPHTPPANTQSTTPAGGPDKFGRNPGDQHYGHDHE